MVRCCVEKISNFIFYWLLESVQGRRSVHMATGGGEVDSAGGEKKERCEAIAVG